MKIKYRFWFSYKIGKTVRKRITIPLVLSSLIIVLIFSFNITLNKYLHDGLMNDYIYNSFFVTYSATNDTENKAIEKLRKIDHIDEVYIDYENQYSVYLKKIGNNEVKGSFYLIGSNKQMLSNISNGGKVLDKYDMICPKKFYPSDNIEENHFIKSNNIIIIDNMIGSTFKAYYYKYIDDKNSEIKNIDLNLVGTYANNTSYIDENVCYVSRELITDIFNDAYENVNMSNQINSLIIRIDNINNYESVKDQIRNLNYDLSSMFLLNSKFLDFVKLLTIILTAFSLVITFIIILNLNKKRIIDKAKEFGILRSIGFSKKELNKLLIVENSIIFVESLFWIVLLSFGIFYILKIIILVYPFIFEKVPISINYLSLLISSVNIFVILVLSVIFYKKRIITDNVIINMGE